MMAENFTKAFFEENRILKAISHYAKRPSEGDLQALKKILQKTYNATDVVLEEHQNDDILGGYMLQIGNKVFDNTFKLTFDKLERQLGTYDFLTFFNTILTDRGSEFGDPEALETGIDGMVRSSIYFCDPMRSGQKGGIEQAHTMLRMILPKKTSFEFLTQWDLRTIVNHINSTPRESLGGRTPYDVALDKNGIDILKALQLRPIPPDEVNLTPKLIRFNR